VERREDEVAGLRRGQRGVDRLQVAHLADEDHVGVLAQRALQRGVEVDDQPHAAALFVRQRTDLHEVPEIKAAMARVEDRLAGQGRLLVRYSGTEPLLRVMLEGKDQSEIHAWASEIVAVVKDQLG